MILLSYLRFKGKGRRMGKEDENNPHLLFKSSPLTCKKRLLRIELPHATHHKEEGGFFFLLKNYLR